MTANAGAAASRPAVTVVMPFFGSVEEAAQALRALRALITRPGDALVLADNAGTAGIPAGRADGVRVVRAAGEHSPAHARNTGAEWATTDWILFIDSDTEAPPDLLDRYFGVPVDDDVGALAGGIVGAPGPTLAARYGAAKAFLDADAHLAHPYLPRAASANLLVRRAAFTAVGGFHEGVRAAEDTDLAWRLQLAGWRLDARPDARIVHRYRPTIGGLRRQWRAYAAGRAWLGRRYEGFAPEPALVRAAGRVVRRGSDESVTGDDPAPSPLPAPRPGRLTRAGFWAIDAVLGIDELAGFALSNRPGRGARPGAQPETVVLVADRFPSPGEPLADYALGLANARIEAAGRPDAVDRELARRRRIDYREDDGAAARALAATWLVLVHPLRAARDRLRRAPGDPSLVALAPTVRRLRRDGPGTTAHALGGEPSASVARRLAALSGRPLR